MILAQTFKLTLETWSLAVIVHKNYVIPLSPLENHVFLMFGLYLAFIRHTLGQSGLKVLLLEKLLKIKTRNCLISSNYT